METQIAASTEYPAKASSGIAMLLLSLALMVGGVLLAISAVAGADGPNLTVLGGG